MAPKELNFITGNKNKLIEVKAIIGDTVELKSQALDLVEIQGTIEEVSADKCRRAAEAVRRLLYSAPSPYTDLPCRSDSGSSSRGGYMSVLQSLE